MDLPCDECFEINWDQLLKAVEPTDLSKMSQ